MVCLSISLRNQLCLPLKHDNVRAVTDAKRHAVGMSWKMVSIEDLSFRVHAVRVLEVWSSGRKSSAENPFRQASTLKMVLRGGGGKRDG